MRAIFTAVVLLVAVAASAAGPAGSAARFDKLLYRPGEAGTLAVRVVNARGAATVERIRVTLVREAADVVPLGERDVTVPARGSATAAFRFTAAPYGTAAKVELLRSGKTLYDYCAAHENLWAVGIGSNWGSGRFTALKKQAENVARMRATYANLTEMFFWGPDDCTDLTPDRPEWWSGQGDYWESVEGTRAAVKACREQGLAIGVYVNRTPAGPAGWEHARRFPERHRRDTVGGVEGYYDVRMLDLWNDPAWRHATNPPRRMSDLNGGNTPWYQAVADWRNAEMVGDHVAEVEASRRAFGWDFVRYDGHLTVAGDDEASAKNMEAVFDGVRCPIGLNYGRHPDWSGGYTREMRVALGRGGMYLQEGIRSFYRAADKYTSWRRYAESELEVCKTVQGLGGTYYHIHGPHVGAVGRYKLALSLVAGAHPLYDEFTQVPGCPNWGAFMTRFGSMLWSCELVREPDVRFAVSSEALYWKPLLQSRVAGTDRKFVVQHLVNPPASDAIAETAMPAPVGSFEVTYQPAEGESVVRVVLARPESEPFDVELPVTRDADGVCRVRVAGVDCWSMLLWELSGRFDAYTPPEPPPLPKQIAVTGADPNKRPALEPRADRQVVEIVGRNNGHPADVAPDPDAADGLTQFRTVDGSLAGKEFVYPMLGQSYIGPLRAGKYDFRLRLKRVPEAGSPDLAQVWMRVELHGDKQLVQGWWSVPGQPNRQVNPGGEYRDLGPPGEYAYYGFDGVEVPKSGYVMLSAAPQNPAANGRYTLLLDQVVADAVALKSDAELEKTEAVGKPDGLRTPDGARPAKALVVRGLWWEPWRLPRDARTTHVYDLPDSHEALYAYDALVLANVDLTASPYAQRQVIRDFVRDGGRLVILGGMQTLGQGGFKGTFLDELCPFVLRGGFEVVKDRLALPTGEVYWRHDVSPKADAVAFVEAQGAVLGATRAYGAGSVVAFVGTVNGEGEEAFWSSERWPGVVEGMVYGDR